MHEALDRYFQLRCHDDADFRARLDVLRAWKIQRMLSGYTGLVQDEGERALLHYYIDEIFFGVELAGLRNPRGALKAAQTVFPDTGMLSVNADAKLTPIAEVNLTHLGEDGGSRALTMIDTLRPATAPR